MDLSNFIVHAEMSVDEADILEWSVSEADYMAYIKETLAREIGTILIDSGIVSISKEEDSAMDQVRFTVYGVIRKVEGDESLSGSK